MKRFFLFLIIITGLSLVYSCSKEERDPVLDMSQADKPAITFPADGAAFVLAEADIANEMTNFQWSATKYNLDNLSDSKYILQMDVVDNTFANALTLQSAGTNSFSITVGAMNQKLLGANLTTGESHNVYFRVISFINSQTGYESLISNVLTLAITPYTDVVLVKPIYMLGDATDAGWTNTLALPLTHVGGSVFSIVANLQAAKGIKFISKLGAWAPQWGTDAAGTSTGGVLVYRPDETVPDPAQIPSPAEAGQYLITVDTALLTYTIGSPSPELYLLGDGSPAGWSNTDAIPMNGTGGNYSLTLDLPGGGFLKFITTLGQWAPMYGTDATGTATGGPLVYRPDEATTDPPAIPAPAAAGSYTITVNTTNLTYTIE
ncbi:MAG: hypothetical protein FD155_1248 [Bacteroidetes bacterium]|nr:MAG: hypothetical protein FD155_1248 [Bacteroidota bacterium]